LKTIAQWLAQAHQDIPANIRRQILSHVLNKNSAWLFGHDDVQLNEHQINQLNQYLEQHRAGKPLAYIIGQQPFWDLTLKVNEHTLIPRPDTELIIETVQSLSIEPDYILDLGTGSGALALVLARLFTKSQVMATDISVEALRMASSNAQQYQIKNITFQQSRWFDDVRDHNFDLIVSNPPYIEAEDPHLKDLSHEPLNALVSGQDGLNDLKIIIEQARNHLSNHGLLMVEHGYNQQQAVTDIFSRNGYSNIQTLVDIEQRPRATMGYQG